MFKYSYLVYRYKNEIFFHLSNFQIKEKKEIFLFNKIEYNNDKINNINELFK